MFGEELPILITQGNIRGDGIGSSDMTMTSSSLASDPGAAPEAAPEHTSERRIAERHACDGFAEVVVHQFGSLFRGEIRDLSKFGCFITTRARLNLKRSADVELRFTVAGTQFSLLGRIAAVRQGVGVGFEFSEIKPATLKRLMRLIEELGSRTCVR